MKKFFIVELASVRDFYLFSTLFAIIVVVFSLTFLLNDYFNFKADVVTEVKEQNDRAKNKFVDSILYTKHIMRHVGKQAANHGVDDYKFINNLLISYRIVEDDLLTWSTFSWVDKNQKLVVSSNNGIMETPIDMSIRDYMPLTARYPETIQMGRPVYGVISGLWSIPIGYGVVDKNNKYLGTVVTGIVLDGLKSQFESCITSRNVSFALIDMKGEPVMISDNFKQNENRKFLDKFLDRVKTKTTQKNFAYKAGYYQKLDEYPYGVVTIYNSKFLSVTTENRFTIYLIVMFTIIAFSGFIFYVFHENVVNPIAQLAQIARQVSRGQKAGKIPEFNVAEINDLGKALKHSSDLNARIKAQKDSENF